MKKAFTVIASLLWLSVVPVRGEDDEDRFHKGEWDISPFGTYADKTGDKWGLGASATYFLTQNWGIGATTYWTDFGGTFFDNAAAEGYFRIPILKVLSPYAVASIGYQFDSKEGVETFGVGTDFRPFKNIAAFSDIQYRIANDTQDGVFIRLGVRFSF